MQHDPLRRGAATLTAPRPGMTRRALALLCALAAAAAATLLATRPPAVAAAATLPVGGAQTVQEATGGPVTVEGFIEEIRPNGYVRGWAYSSATPGAPAPWTITGSGNYNAEIAVVHRPDVKGGGPYGFEGWLGYHALSEAGKTIGLAVDVTIDVPDGLDSGVRQETVAFSLTEQLPTPVNTAPEGFLEAVAPGVGTGHGWAVDRQQPGVPVSGTVSVACLTPGTVGNYQTELEVPVATDQLREDVNAALGATGTHGFTFSIPQPERFRNRDCNVSARMRDAGGNPLLDVGGSLQTSQTATLNIWSLPFD